MQHGQTRDEAKAHISESSRAEQISILTTPTLPRTVNKKYTAVIRRTVKETYLFVSRDPEKFIEMKTQQCDLSGKGSPT